MALLFTGLLSLSACILGYFLYDFGRQDLMQETEAAIDAEINVLKALSPQGISPILTYIQNRSQDDHMVYFRYENGQGVLLGGTLEKLPSTVKVFSEGILRLPVETHHSQQTLGIKIHTFPDGSTMVVGRDIHRLLASYDRLKLLSLLIVGLMSVVVCVSFIISHFVVNRINRIAKTAYDIVNTGDLSRRISVQTNWDDLSNLAQVLNGFLSQIESLMAGVREVSNNIAHDLRTPLTSLRHHIESLKGRTPTDDDLDSLLNGADRILSVFQSLLRIANLEKGKRYKSLQIVDLSVILRDVIELYEPLAEEKSLTLQCHIHENLPIMGDADLLFQLFANVLDNAIKFSPTASSICITARQDITGIVVSVEDHGFGITDEEKQQVFKHFYRSDKSRTLQGNGLGLSLVKAIVDYHKAQIQLCNGKVGLLVLVTFEPYQNVRIEKG